MTNTPSVEGRSITEYFGIVSTVALIAESLKTDTGEKFLMITAGVRETSIKKLQEQAEPQGADAIVGIRIGYTCMGVSEAGPPLLMVSISGTAVKLA